MKPTPDYRVLGDYAAWVGTKLLRGEPKKGPSHEHTTRKTLPHHHRNLRAAKGR